MKYFTAIISAALIILFVLPLTAIAQDPENKKDVVLAKDEVINKDYFATGNSIFLDGTVNGDAYVAGGNVVVNGTINGDLLAAGGNLDIRGNITGNIRAAGGNINISGTIDRNATLAGGSINITPTADIKGSLVSAGGNVTVSAPIGKEINLGGGQVVLGNRIGGDVNAAVGNLSLAPTATISGNLTYLSENPASVSPGATVSGKITQNVPQTKQPEEAAKRGIGALLSFFLIGDFLLATIIGFLLLKFLPVFFSTTAQLITQKPWLSLGIGFLTAIISPFVFLLLLITIIGIPIAMLLAFALVVLSYLAKIFVAFVIGQLILGRFSKQPHTAWALILGLVIYSLVKAIPIFGWLISVIAILTGLGALLIAKKNYYRNLRTKEII
jgi:cytoskeletal protein CcmA (bactofilin family)